MNEARRQMAMGLPIAALVAEYDRAMEERGQQADLHHAASEGMEQFRKQLETLKADIEARISAAVATEREAWRDACEASISHCRTDCTPESFCGQCEPLLAILTERGPDRASLTEEKKP